jgi:CENP-B N-terminal DNA-binding domain
MNVLGGFYRLINSFFASRFIAIILMAMPYPYSKAHRRKLAALMKRRRTDPAFNAIQRAAMQRLWADPEYRARHRAAMQRHWADPECRASARCIPAETRAAIVAALNADPNAKRVAKKIPGATYGTVLRVAKAARIELHHKLTPRHRGDACRRYGQGESLSSIARVYNVHPSTISRLPKPALSSRALAERIVRGLAIARARGVKLGRKPKLAAAFTDARRGHKMGKMGRIKQTATNDTEESV